MSIDITQARHVSRVEMGSVGSAELNSAVAPMVALPTAEGAASEAEVRAALDRVSARLSSMVGELADPETAIMAVASLLENSGIECNRAQSDGARSIRQAHVQAQAEAAKKAAENEKTAAFWGLIGKIAAYTAAAVGVAVSLVSCVVTGPTGVAGAVGIIAATAACLSLIGTAVGDITKAAAANDPEFAKNMGGWFSIAVSALSMTAAILGVVANPANIASVLSNVGGMIGQSAEVTQQALRLSNTEIPAWASGILIGLSAAGSAAGAAGVSQVASAAANTAGRASEAVRTMTTVSRVVQGTAQITAGASDAASAVHGFMATNDRIEARVHGQGARKAMEVLAELADELRELASSVSRQRGRALDLGQERTQTNSNLIRNMVRA